MAWLKKITLINFSYQKILGINAEEITEVMESNGSEWLETKVRVSMRIGDLLWSLERKILWLDGFEISHQDISFRFFWPPSNCMAETQLNGIRYTWRYIPRVYLFLKKSISNKKVLLLFDFLKMEIKVPPHLFGRQFIILWVAEFLIPISFIIFSCGTIIFVHLNETQHIFLFAHCIQLND